MNIKDLPFVREREDGTIDAWSPTRTGNYELDFKSGTTSFNALVVKGPSPAQIAHVFNAIVEKGELSGVEIGFIHAMSLNIAT